MRIIETAARPWSAIALAAALAANLTAVAGECGTADGSSPRTLILALDGVPYRVLEQARELGAFADWPEPSRLIAPFPSVTNVSFSLMLQDYGIEPAEGYEFQHFDVQKNRVVGSSPIGYRERSFAWRDEFDSMGRTISSKIAVYTIPRRKSRRELAAAERELLSSQHDVVLAHVGSTDALQHLRGDGANVELLGWLDDWLAELKLRHLEKTGRPLNVVLLSDHGNSLRKIRGVQGLRKRLRRNGLRVVKRLKKPNDVVAATFGIVGFGALYLRPEFAEQASEVVVGHPHVELAAWRAGPNEVRVVSTDGSSTIRWRDEETGRRFAYAVTGVDPLRLGKARADLEEAARFDAEGFAADDDWFERTARGVYPDALHRIVDGLTGEHLRYHAAVLFSVSRGHAWGLPLAHVAARLRGGRIEGTHGGLDDESTIGFFLADSKSRMPGAVLRADEALRAWSAARLESKACLERREAGVADVSTSHNGNR